jgi:Holliday junction DNA helicase RuvB
MTSQLRNEVNEVAPTELADLIGQRSVVQQVRVALCAAHQDDKSFDHALLVGPAGCGKTQTAKVIAAEMGGDFHEVLGQTLETPADLNGLLLSAKDKDVVFIDEAALTPSEQQHALLLALDQRRIVLAGGRVGKSPQSIPLGRFTLLMATTDEYRLINPLIERCRLVLRFVFYAEEELAEITGQRCRALDWRIDESVLPFVAQRSVGVPRRALRIVQAARRVARSEGEHRITLDHAVRACELEGIDSLGLGTTESAYLRILAEGTTRLNVISSRIGLPARTISTTESLLIRLELVDKDEKGKRILTRKGYEHLKTIEPTEEQS